MPHLKEIEIEISWSHYVRMPRLEMIVISIWLHASLYAQSITLKLWSESQLDCMQAFTRSWLHWSPIFWALALQARYRQEGIIKWENKGGRNWDWNKACVWHEQLTEVVIAFRLNRILERPSTQGTPVVRILTTNVLAPQQAAHTLLHSHAFFHTLSLVLVGWWLKGRIVWKRQGLMWWSWKIS